MDRRYIVARGNGREIVEILPVHSTNHEKLFRHVVDVVNEFSESLPKATLITHFNSSITLRYKESGRLIGVWSIIEITEEI